MRRPVIHVRVAAARYSHLAALAGDTDGTGDLAILREVLEPGQIFRRMLEEEAFDVAEMSLATVFMLADRGDPRFVALPVFPSRCFRHSALYVPAGSRVRDPHELAGGRVGVLRYAMTTGVWVRALLAEEHGVTPESVEWWVGEPSTLPDGIRAGAVDGPEALEALAVAGELDCLITGKPPGAFRQGRLRRLFAEPWRAERDYYRRTGVFPIMHAVVATRALADRWPGALDALRRRFDAAKEVALAELLGTDLSLHPLPWLTASVEEALSLMGPDPWPYGVAPNRGTLMAFGRHMAAQGLTARPWRPEDVFREA